MTGAPDLNPQVGQRVQVDVSGMQIPDGLVPAGTLSTGTVTHVDPEGRLTIRLDVAVGGYALITASAGRIRAII